jgi:hypothetical protein
MSGKRLWWAFFALVVETASRIRILDPDPAIFVIDLQDANKKLIFVKQFFPVLRIRIRKNPKLLAGSGSDPDPK